jgi:hypothetical protein
LLGRGRVCQKPDLGYLAWACVVGFIHDVDVVYFDATDIDTKRDDAIEAELRVAIPKAPWSVKNQARMHLQKGDSPYANTADAMRHWPETCTAVAVRTFGSRVGFWLHSGLTIYSA